MFASVQTLVNSHSSVGSFLTKITSLIPREPTSSNFIRPEHISLEAIEKARNLKFGKTKHALIMLLGRLQEAYGKVHAGLFSLSSMLIESIGKQLAKRQMKNLSAWLQEASLVTRRWRDHNYGKYHYDLSEMCMAYYHMHRYRIQKSAPDILKKCTSYNTKIDTKKKIIAKSENVDNSKRGKTEISEKSHDYDLVNKPIVEKLVIKAGVFKTKALEWIKRYGEKAIQDVFERSKAHNPKSLGAYMNKIIETTPPDRVDKQRFVTFIGKEDIGEPREMNPEIRSALRQALKSYGV